MLEEKNQLTLRGLWAATNATSTGVAIADMLLPDHPLVFVNPAFEKMTGYRSDEVIGLNCRFLQGSGTDPSKVAMLSAGLRQGCNVNCLLQNYRKDGSAFWNDLTMSPIFEEGKKLTGFVAIQKDVTAEVELRRELAREVGVIAEIKDELKSANEELRRIAYIDTVTGLPTRKLLYDRGGQSLAHAKRSGELFAIIFMDLDGFKQVNDVFGHDAGDTALRYVAERISDQIRETDTLSRVGGDEYILLVDTSVSHDVVAEICNRIHKVFMDPFLLGDDQVYLDVSIGTAIYPHDADSVEDLVCFADAAMYEAKRSKSVIAPRSRLILSA